MEPNFFDQGLGLRFEACVRYWSKVFLNIYTKDIKIAQSMKILIKLILLDSLLQEVWRTTGQVLGLHALLFGTPLKLNGREATPHPQIIMRWQRAPTS
jgi:hypothetical protein